ncbi:MAG: response regulator, partial [Terriglobia bacterium]
GVALLEGHLRPELRDEAEREAHKLTGSLSTLGYGAGSRFAREIERLLQSGIEFSESQAMRFSELTVALRLDLEDMPLAAEAAKSGPKTSTLLVVNRDEEFAGRIEVEASGQDLLVRSAKDIQEALEAVSTHAPDVVLLDLLVSGNEDEGMALLDEFSGRTPPVPVIVLTSKNGFTDLVEVARRGGRGFLATASSAAQMLDAVTRLISRLHAADARVMAIDDDAGVLEALRELLEPRNIRLKTVDDPLRFWDALESFAPDLLLLDVDMPHLNGVELCRVVRNDARWAEIPVVFLTAHNDADTIYRVFTAGADDFVAKPVVGPELLTRIFNRLDRVRLRRCMLETDPVSGAWNRRKASQMMSDFIDLARRHGQPFSMALVHLKGLEFINREQGYGTGDSVLRRVSEALSARLRSEDVFGRWTGDEFAVGMYGLNRYDGVQRLTQLLQSVRDQGDLSPVGACPILNGGVAQYGEDGTNLESLSKSAEAALLYAQSAGNGHVAHAGWTKDSATSSNCVDVVLIMGDEAQASLLLHILESKGCRTRWLQDGKTACRLLAGPEPPLRSKVALIDVDLPGLDGISLLKRLAWDGALETCRAIMLTAPSVAKEAQAALELGAVDYVVKPFNPPVVVQHIRRALDAA